MKQLILFIFLVIATISNCQINSFDKARISEINYFYEYPDSYAPFDFLETNDCNENPIKVEYKNNNHIKFSLKIADCFTAINVYFSLDSNLNVLNANYSPFSDNLSDNEGIRPSVDQFILYLNKNPFEDTINLIGRFNMIIKDNHLGNDFYYPFNGKFKLYANSDKKLTREELRLKMEKDKGRIDENGIYDIPETDPEYCFGNDSLNDYLKRIISKRLDNNGSGLEVQFELIIDESGKVEFVKTDPYPTIDKEIIIKINKDIYNSCWIPAVNHGKTVKSKIYYMIKIE